MKLYSCCTWLALALHMYQVPTFCFLESPWLSLIGGIKGVQSEYLCSHCNHSLHLCLRLHVIRMPLPGAHPPSPVSYPAVSFECRAASLVFMYNVSATHYKTHIEWANDTCACLLLVTYIGLQKAFSKDHCLTHEYLLLNCWILPGPCLDKTWLSEMIVLRVRIVFNVLFFANFWGFECF